MLRTPDHCFKALPDFPFPPRYVVLDDPRKGPLRMHYVEAGPADRGKPTVLLLHGEPSWSFSWRHVIAELAGQGIHSIAPDHIGFGRSDKLAHQADYSYAAFVEWLCAFIVQQSLRNIVLVAQDWGGPIGLSALAAMPDRFAGIVLTNTLLPNCEPPPRGIPDWPDAAIRSWIELAASADDLAVGQVIAAVSVTPLSPAVVAAYDAPFPDVRYKAAARVFPALIPITETMPGIAENRAVWKVLEQWERPVVTAFSDSDPSTKPWEAVFQRRIPGAAGQPHVEIAGAGHFVQEERGSELAQAIAGLVQRLTPDI